VRAALEAARAAVEMVAGGKAAAEMEAAVMEAVQVGAASASTGLVAVAEEPARNTRIASCCNSQSVVAMATLASVVALSAGSPSSCKACTYRMKPALDCSQRPRVVFPSASRAQTCCTMCRYLAFDHNRHRLCLPRAWRHSMVHLASVFQLVGKEEAARAGVVAHVAGSRKSCRSQSTPALGAGTPPNLLAELWAANLVAQQVAQQVAGRHWK
jgi:hypothetical protein